MAVQQCVDVGDGRLTAEAVDVGLGDDAGLHEVFEIFHLPVGCGALEVRLPSGLRTPVRLAGRGDRHGGVLRPFASGYAVGRPLRAQVLLALLTDDLRLGALVVALDLLDLVGRERARRDRLRIGLPVADVLARQHCGLLGGDYLGAAAVAPGAFLSLAAAPHIGGADRHL